MSDNSDEPVVEPEVVTAETKASDRGWRPQDEWEGEPQDWISAEVFNARGELMDIISSQSKQIKGYKKSVDDIKGHMAAREERVRQETKADLLAQKVVAMEEQNHEEVVKLEEKIKDADAIKSVEPTPPANPIAEYFEGTWLSKNEWYNDPSKEEQVVAADMAGQQYMQSYPDASPEALFTYVDKVINKQFGKAKAPAKSAVASSDGTGRSKGKSGSKAQIAALTKMERKTGEQFARQGLMTLEEYAADIAAMSE